MKSRITMLNIPTFSIMTHRKTALSMMKPRISTLIVMTLSIKRVLRIKAHRITNDAQHNSIQHDNGSAYSALSIMTRSIKKCDIYNNSSQHNYTQS
jgi:hypothetical protein